MWYISLNGESHFVAILSQTVRIKREKKKKWEGNEPK